MNLLEVTPASGYPLTIAEILPRLRLDSSNAEPAPNPPSVALAAAGAGNVDNGAHRYRVTFGTATGETEGGAPSVAVTVADKTVNGKVAVSNIQLGGSAVLWRKLYRTQAAGSVYLFHSLINDNTTTSIVDNTADSGLGAGAPVLNTTSDPLLTMLLAGATKAVETITRRALLTQVWELSLDCFPNWQINIPKPPLRSVDLITYVDNDGTTQTLASDQYLVDPRSEPARLTPAWAKVWPPARPQMNAVTVRFTCGYGAPGAVPQGIKDWICMRMAALLQNPSEIVIDYQATLAVIPKSFMDGLLDPYNVRDFSWAK